MQRIRGFSSVIVALVCAVGTAQDDSLRRTLDRLVEDGKIVAAQAVIGHGDTVAVEHAVGVINPEGDRVVDSQTLFCIGSCSKPFASAVVMTLAQDGILDLEKPVDQLLPEFGQLQLRDSGDPARAPTMKELLTHRSGIYSQKKGMTKQQAGWIRNFQLTLKESVDGIAGEPLISVPGTEYAYSGAGYCVVGRVAEVAAGKPFEELLQRRICRPLTLKRTTYFPAADEMNIAAGGQGGQANPNTPHLTTPALKFPLIGGSLYSTARETAQFLQAVANKGRVGSKIAMSEDMWKTWTSRPYADGGYGYGWGLISGDSADTPIAVSHNGSLASSRSTMIVSLKTRVFAVVHYTIARPDRAIAGEITRAIGFEVRRLKPQPQ